MAKDSGRMFQTEGILVQRLRTWEEFGMFKNPEESHVWLEYRGWAEEEVGEEALNWTTGGHLLFIYVFT